MYLNGTFSRTFQKVAKVVLLLEQIFCESNDILIPHSKRLSNTNFVLSLTTSPQRLPLLNFDTLTGYRKIFLNLPKLYRNCEAYDKNEIAELCLQVPRIQINWIDHDLGPATKFLGALAYAKHSDNIVVIDDDITYKNDLLQIYDKELKADSRQLVFCPNNPTDLGFKTVMGYKSFCVRIHDLLDITESTNVKEMSSKVITTCERFFKAHKTCERHDDLVFSAAFKTLGLQIKYFYNSTCKIRLSGLDNDALHAEEPHFHKNIECGAAIWDTWQECPADEDIYSFVSLMRN
jgi:glycosyltransferase involved in cell wall biosynthesis